MSDVFVQAPLGSLVDYVTKSPEGVVNFNLLNTILHVLVQQLDAGELSVELRGTTAESLQEAIKASDKNTKVTKVEVKDSGGDKAKNVVVVDEGTANGDLVVTKKNLDDLKQDINQINEKIEALIELPSNTGIIEALKGGEEKICLDMYQVLSLSKRMDATEIAFNKLSSLVEEVLKIPAGDIACNTLGDDKMKAIMDEIASIRATLDTLMGGGDESDEDGGKSLADLFRDVDDLKTMLGRGKGKRDGMDEELTDDMAGLPPVAQLALLDEKFKECCGNIDKMDQNLNDEITKLQNQFTDIEKDFNEILARIQNSLPAGDQSLDEPNQCCTVVYQKMLKLQADLEEITDQSAKLIEDKGEKEKLMDEMLEQIELLKTIKADKEDIEEALADKADACAVRRKVSHDQFDIACDELSKGIEEALEKLTQQELLWQQALDTIQSEIDTKLDKMDLGPLREFINNKLRMLQDRMKSLAALKREQEAAGTKSRFLRNVNCISCDKDVIMRKEMDGTMRPPPTNLPPTRSMGPYLAYELDVLRKQQKAIPGSKNMNALERAMNQKGLRKADDHLCNRYCGGSHTVTTAQQRVTRLGHFLAQWGPEARPEEIPEEIKEVEKKTSITTRGSKVSGEDALRSKTTVRASATSARKSATEKAEGSKTTVGTGRKSDTPRRSDASRKSETPKSEGRRPSDQSKRTSTGSKRGSAQTKTSKIAEETPSQLAMAEGGGEAPPAPSPSLGQVEGGDQAGPEGGAPPFTELPPVEPEAGAPPPEGEAPPPPAEGEAPPPAESEPPAEGPAAEPADAPPPAEEPPPAEAPPAEEPPADAPPADDAAPPAEPE